MTVRTDFLQVGVSNTSTQNFTLKTNNDGTAKLARGNFDATTQDVINVNASGVVDFPQGATIGGSAGQKMLLTASQATTSGTFVDFTGIPSWAKKITVLYDGVSTTGTSRMIIQLGTSSGFVTTNYSSTSSYAGATNAAGYATFTAGFGLVAALATSSRVGAYEAYLQSGSTWVAKGLHFDQTAPADATYQSIGRVTVGGVVDRIRITTVNGTDTFDAGSVSLLIEGY